MSCIYLHKEQTLSFRCALSRWWASSDHIAELSAGKQLTCFIIIITFNLHNHSLYSLCQMKLFIRYTLFPLSDETDSKQKLTVAHAVSKAQYWSESPWSPVRIPAGRLPLKLLATPSTLPAFWLCSHQISPQASLWPVRQLSLAVFLSCHCPRGL